jgi:hypothetical protein
MILTLAAIERWSRRLFLCLVHRDTPVHLCPSMLPIIQMSLCHISDALMATKQNNGVIAITRCANRQAGRFCCLFLILFGVLGKISGVFLASELCSYTVYTDAVPHTGISSTESSAWWRYNVPLCFCRCLWCESIRLHEVHSPGSIRSSGRVLLRHW